MDENTRIVIEGLILFGWVPILAIGKAISWIIESLKNNNNE